MRVLKTATLQNPGYVFDRYLLFMLTKYKSHPTWHLYVIDLYALSIMQSPISLSYYKLGIALSDIKIEFVCYRKKFQFVSLVWKLISWKLNHLFFIYDILCLQNITMDI